MKVLVTDIGGTFIKYAVMDEELNIYNKGKVPTPRGSRAELIEAIRQLYENVGAKKSEAACAEETNSAGTEISGIAVSLPGVVDPQSGRVFIGGALTYNDGAYLRDEIEQRCGVKVFMENDAKCATLIEIERGALKDVNDGFILLYGTMIGGGVVKDRKLHRGTHSSAGEVSYIITDRDGNAGFDEVWGNRCGIPRLLGMYAERLAERKARGEVLAENSSAGACPCEVTGEIFFEAVEAGDEDAIWALDVFTKEIAVQIFNIQTLLDPELFAIGGGVSAQPAFLEAIQKNLDGLYANSYYPVTQAKITKCAYGNDANLYGAMIGYLDYIK